MQTAVRLQGTVHSEEEVSGRNRNGVNEPATAC